MKIIFFYQYFGTPKGSWSTRVYELSKRWVEMGYSVTVVTAPYDKSDIKSSKFISKQNIDGIDLIVINSGDSNKLSVFTRVIRALLFSVVSIWYSLTEDYDVCIASSGPITIGLPMIMSKKIRNKPTIFEVRDLWPAGAIELNIIKGKLQKNIALWFEKLCYKSADMVITASLGQKQYIDKKNLLKRVEVIPNASDINLFGKKATGVLPEWTVNKFLFTHIGSLGLIHNIDYWMNVAREAKLIDTKKEIVFVFIGDGADKERLLQLKNKYNLSNVYFLGIMPKNELPIWVQSSRATLFATLDNFVQSTCSPNKIFDSFAAGIPIVQTSKGWIKELVNNNNCGINVDLKIPKNAAEKILWLCNNSDQVSLMGENAFKLAEGEFNRDILAVKYIDYILNVIKSKK